MNTQNVNRARYYQRQLEEAETRADAAESQVSMMRSKHHTVITSGRRPSLVVVDQRSSHIARRARDYWAQRHL